MTCHAVPCEVLVALVHVHVAATFDGYDRHADRIPPKSFGERVLRCAKLTFDELARGSRVVADNADAHEEADGRQCSRCNGDRLEEQQDLRDLRKRRRHPAVHRVGERDQ